MLEDDVSLEESGGSESESGSLGSLYADHEIRRNLVIGPVEIKKPVLTFKFRVPTKEESQPKSSGPTCRTCQTENVKHYTCSECGTLFYSSLSMIAHVRRHTHPVICKICNIQFQYAFRLKKHMIKHSNVRQFTCDICQKAYKYETSLQVHKCVKPRKKPFHCEYCSKSFAFKGQLQAHTRFHTGEKPYECHLCSDKFSQQTSLNNHLLKHKGIKPHRCKLCKETFRQVSNLKQHIKVKHLDGKVERHQKSRKRPSVALVWYSCKNCKSMFLGSKQFDKHMKVCK